MPEENKREDQEGFWKNADLYWAFCCVGGRAGFSEEARASFFENFDELLPHLIRSDNSEEKVNRLFLKTWLAKESQENRTNSKREQMLLLCFFATHWSASFIADVLKIPEHSFRFKLFQALRAQLPDFSERLGHLSANCARFDLRLIDALENGNSPWILSKVLWDKGQFETHKKGCSRCSTFFDQCLALKENYIGQIQSMPLEVKSQTQERFHRAGKVSRFSFLPFWLQLLLLLASIATLLFLLASRG